MPASAWAWPISTAASPVPRSLTPAPDAEWSDITDGAPFSGSFDGTDVSFGVGASLNFTRNLGLRAEWERSKLINADADFVSVGLVYRF